MRPLLLAVLGVGAVSATAGAAHMLVSIIGEKGALGPDGSPPSNLVLTSTSDQFVASGPWRIDGDLSVDGPITTITSGAARVYRMWIGPSAFLGHHSSDGLNNSAFTLFDGGGDDIVTGLCAITTTTAKHLSANLDLPEGATPRRLACTFHDTDGSRRIGASLRYQDISKTTNANNVGDAACFSLATTDAGSAGYYHLASSGSPGHSNCTATRYSGEDASATNRAYILVLDVPNVATQAAPGLCFMSCVVSYTREAL